MNSTSQLLRYLVSFTASVILLLSIRAEHHTHYTQRREQWNKIMSYKSQRGPTPECCGAYIINRWLCSRILWLGKYNILNHSKTNRKFLIQYISHSLRVIMIPLKCLEYLKLKNIPKYCLLMSREAVLVIQIVTRKAHSQIINSQVQQLGDPVSPTKTQLFSPFDS